MIFGSYNFCICWGQANTKIRLGHGCCRDRYKTHFYCLAVEAGFYSDVVECLPLDPAAQVRFPPGAVGIFLHPVTFGERCCGEGGYSSFIISILSFK